MSRGLDLADIRFFKLLDVAEDVSQLGGELLLLVGSQLNPCKIRHVMNVE